MSKDHLDTLRVLRDKQIIENLCQTGTFTCTDGADCKCVLKTTDSRDLFNILKNYDDAVNHLLYGEKGG